MPHSLPTSYLSTSVATLQYCMLRSVMMLYLPCTCANMGNSWHEETQVSGSSNQVHIQKICNHAFRL